MLVDDCGQDGSLSIAQAFCDSMENFRLIRREERPADYFATLDVDPAWEQLRKA